MQDIVLRKIDFLSGNDFIYGGKIPHRLMYLRDIVEGTIGDPTYTAYQRLKLLQQYMPSVFSDIYRSPASSAEAYQRKTGVAKPGYSGHNYGVSVDLAIDATMKRHNISYNTLVNNMISFGWTPFQGKTNTGTYKRGKEDWHFNFIGDHGYDINLDTSINSGSVQMNSWISANYDFSYDLISIQSMLKSLKLYQGAIDGESGPLTNEAIIKFKRAWYPAKILGNPKPNLDQLAVRMINIVSCNVKDQNGALII